ncbi:MAG TPA: hypothetical protein VGN32_11425 [Ktedonobacterales bacterium]|jgi:hypothetical protein|nr:hypothetical protein [Ktedonobacterales bacterium]
MKAPGVGWPRLAAWLVVVLLVGVTTAASLRAMRQLAPVAPPDVVRVEGLVVAMRPDGTFALREPGHGGWLWLRPAPGAGISLAHLWRHLREHAETDVSYEVERHGMALAWIAD